MENLIGQTILDRYNIIEELGTGGFGTTYVATDKMIPVDNKVVVKVLDYGQELGSNVSPSVKKLVQERFLEEAKVLFKLSSGIDNIPKLLAYSDKDNKFFIVQEMIEGHNLEYLILNQMVDKGDMQWFLSEALKILIKVHDQNIIHRDIKPANFIISRTDNGGSKLHLIDFGAVKQEIKSHTVIASAKSIIIGTEKFMPTEQKNGEPSVRSDIYALGVTAMCICEQSIDSNILTDVDTGDLILGENICSEYYDIIAKATRFHQKNRFESAADMLNSVNQIIEAGRPHNQTPVVEPTEFIDPRIGSHQYSYGSNDIVNSVEFIYSQPGSSKATEVTGERERYEKAQSPKQVIQDKMDELDQKEAQINKDRAESGMTQREKNAMIITLCGLFIFVAIVFAVGNYKEENDDSSIGNNITLAQNHPTQLIN